MDASDDLILEGVGKAHPVLFEYFLFFESPSPDDIFDVQLQGLIDGMV